MTTAQLAHETDEHLMLAAAKGNLAAFEALVTRHQDRVYRMVVHNLRREEDAWDVSQEVFMKVYNARHTYVEDAKFTTWLYRIANNAIIDRMRQNVRKNKNVSFDDLVAEPEDPNRGSHHHVELTEVKKQMSAALSSLSERQRSMVILKYYEGCSVKEIADVFDCAAGTVKATLFQAVSHLKERLAGKGLFSAEVGS